MENNLNMTQVLDSTNNPDKIRPDEIMTIVHTALIEKGYNPVNQLVGYILSGDPTYITSHNNARNLICRIERDELLEEFVTSYIKAL